MAVVSMVYDSVAGDRQYSSADFSRLFARFAGQDGVVFGYGNQLAVSAGTGMVVQVATGAAWVQGRYVEVISPETLGLAAADPTNPRIDRVVVRINLSARTGTVAVKTGTPAASPAAPALQRDGTVWELSLAQVSVPAGATAPGTITDERGNTSVCGYAGFATLQATGSGLVAQDSAYSSGVAGFTPTSVKAALDALAGVRIVEKGSNANGEYVRWGNGLQACWASLPLAGAAYTTAIGPLYQRDQSINWTFPAGFLSVPVVVSTWSRDTDDSSKGFVAILAVRTSGVTLRPVAAASVGGSALGHYAQLVALGAWK